MVFAITDSPSEKLVGMQIYFVDGYPKGHEIITSDSDDLVMKPELLSIYPSEGSVAGSRLEVKAPGVGISSVVEVTNSDGDSICESVTVESFGLVVCITKAIEIDSEIKIKTDDGELHAWYSRAVPADSSNVCPEVDEIYTDEYWQTFYEENHAIESATYFAYQQDDLSFDFGSWFMANHEELTEDHIESFLD